MIESRHLALPANVLEKIEEFLGPERRLGTVEQLPVPKLVADCCDKFIALDVAARPAAFVVVSPELFPNSVRDAANTTHAIRSALGPSLGDAVLVPYFVGDIEQRSYSITAYCEPMSSRRWISRWQRMRMAPAILSWLTEATRASAKQTADVDDTIRAPLKALAAHERIDTATRQAASAALDDFERGLWRPRSVVAHNDLWWGNFLHRQRVDGAPRPFYLIDWGGGQIDGVPFYDLVRVSNSLNVSARRFRRTLLAHCDILECRPEDSLSYLCVALGRLLSNLGEWPEEQFDSTARSCLRYAAAALR